MTDTAPNPPVQATHVDFALHTLGWKAFQDLAVAVASEVLGRPVETFLSSNDGGRDGAFVGRWADGGNAPEAKSTIQCKFTSKADATLTLGDVANELRKVASLAKRGLAHDYILLTNAGVSGERAAEISAAIEAAGAKRARVLGRDWLTQEIRSRPRLRMMVPRLYGLGDLSQIIDVRAYDQARHILSAARDDLAAFVTTEAHRQSVEALRQHRFVVLLGDPGSGKSAIGASLALGALDDGASGTLKLSSGEEFERHWNPNEPGQFFLIDDAFGETQYQRTRIDGWNSRLRLMRAAVKAGARVLMTSRTYIWNAAMRDLKLSEFPLLGNSHVIIDVQGLSDVERAQILYNHIRRGDQPSAWRERLRPFLPGVAVNPRFLPETARRLGTSFFTGSLSLNAAGISSFVEEPVSYLIEVLRTLSEPNRAAIALIFLHGSSGVPSPITDSNALETVRRLSGVEGADVARALQTLEGSLTLLLETETGRRWAFKHPTIADAYAALVAESPEMIEVYIRGAKLEKLLWEVVCGPVPLMGASVRVPQSLYGMLLDRMEENGLLHTDILRFAVHRADAAFFAQLVKRAPTLNDLPLQITSDMVGSEALAFLARAHSNGLLEESIRLAAVDIVGDLTLTWADTAAFSRHEIRSLFTDAEFGSLEAKFEDEVMRAVAKDAETWDRQFFGGDRVQRLTELRDSIRLYANRKMDQPAILELIEEAVASIDRFIATIQEDEADEQEDGEPGVLSPLPHAPEQIASIFDDVGA